MRRSWSTAVRGGRARVLAVAIVAVLAGCGGGGPGASAAPSPTPDTPDKGECVDLAGPDDDIEMTVVDCAGAQYEVLRVIGRLVLKDATCPEGTDLELDRSIQFLRPGQSAGPGGLETTTYCLGIAGETSPPSLAPSPSLVPEVTADDVRYTSRTGLGDPMTITFTLANDGEVDSPPIVVELSDLGDHADVEGCTPACTVVPEGQNLTLAFADGLAAGSSAGFEIELVSTQAGSVTWRLTIYAGAGSKIFTGTGTTEID